MTAEKPPLSENIGVERRIQEAAVILKPLLIGQEDLESLTKAVAKRGPARWRVDEGKVISAVAKAWAIRAPLGVEPADLRNVFDVAGRNAWKGKKDK